MIETTYDLYRCPTNNSAGESKDWAIKISGKSHISVKYGTTGKKLRTSEIKDVKKVSFGAALEKQERIAKKLGEGYEFVGKFDISDTGKQTREQDVEVKSWSFTDFATPMLLQVLSAFVEDFNSYAEDANNLPDGVPPLEVEFDPNIRGITFKCDGHLPSHGWVFGESIMQANPDRGLSDGGGVIHYPIQELLLSAIANFSGDLKLTAVAAKGAEERSLLAAKKGLTSYFINEVGLPRDLVQYVGMATNLIAKPLDLFSQGVEAKASAICF